MCPPTLPVMRSAKICRATGTAADLVEFGGSIEWMYQKCPRVFLFQDGETMMDSGSIECSHTLNRNDNLMRSTLLIDQFLHIVRSGEDFIEGRSHPPTGVDVQSENQQCNDDNQNRIPPIRTSRKPEIPIPWHHTAQSSGIK
jgi:hypothetical protein